MTALYEDEGHALGTVLVKGRRPYRLLAIVHDLDQDPTWREEWVVDALATVLQQCDTLGVRELALEPLGTKHGELPRRRFRELLDNALANAPVGTLRRIRLCKEFNS